MQTSDETTEIPHVMVALPEREITLGIAMAGPEDGPLVVLLHGFPDFWRGWKAQITALAARGFRVLAPDQRGYNESSKPPSTSDYHPRELAADVVALIRRFGDRAHLVGHDMGGMVTWWLAEHHRELLDRVVVLNSPHPWVLRRFTLRRPQQLLRSWYMLFFQLPWLPEAALRLGDWKLLADALRDGTTTGAFDGELGHYRRAWSRDGAARAMVNWYRAATLQFVTQPKPPPMDVMILWGALDESLAVPLGPEHLEILEDPHRLGRIVCASHWVQRDAADAVNGALIRYFEAP